MDDLEQAGRVIPALLPALDAPGATLLCIGAHSDDIEIGAGGTVLRLLSEHPSLAVVWVVFSADGERADEARRAADVFLHGAAERRVDLHRFRDGYLPARWADVKDEFEALKRGVEPALVLAPRREDRHQDHRLVSELTWNTFRRHLIWEYEIAKYEGDLGQPNVFVPLSEEQCAAKVEALDAAFATQRSRTWFDPDLFRGLLRLRGVECSSATGYAEAFTCRKLVV